MFALDLAFEKMNTYGINKLKEIVDSRNEVSNEITNETSEENTQTPEETVNVEMQNSENVSE